MELFQPIHVKYFDTAAVELDIAGAFKIFQQAADYFAGCTQFVGDGLVSAAEFARFHLVNALEEQRRQPQVQLGEADL